MGEPFDAYRDAQVVEKKTLWPGEFAGMSADEKKRIEQSLHADAASASQLDYVRLHTGFCRQITVTADDIERLKQTEPG